MVVPDMILKGKTLNLRNTISFVVMMKDKIVNTVIYNLKYNRPA